MKKKNILLYVSHVKIRDYDWQNRELGLLAQKFNIKIILHDIVEIIRPGYSKIFLNKLLGKKIFFLMI